MFYKRKLHRGVQDRSFTPVKVPMHRDSSHAQVLTKGVSSVFADAIEGAHFYLSDGSGHTITGDDFIVDYPDESNEKIPWTLNNYLRVSCIKYPSRARLYCVAVIPGILCMCVLYCDTL